MKSNYINVSNVSVYFNYLCVLENINFKISKGEFITIYGPNGAGKSTLIKAILGIIKPTKGKVIIKNNIKFGYIPQQVIFNKQTPVNALDVVISGILSPGISFFHKYSISDLEKAENIMKKLNISNLAKKHIGSLSGGQLQKVLIARALVNNPEVIILDEPFNGLDHDSKIENLKILNNLKKTKTIILITHDEEKAIQYSDRILYLNKKINKIISL